MTYSIHTEKEKNIIQLQGKKLEDMFSEGALAVFHALYDTDAIRGNERIKVVVEAKDLSDLFHAWITGLIERADVVGITCGDFRASSIQKISDSRYLLTGIAYGEPFDEKKHGAKKIKSISDISVVHHLAKGVCSCEATLTIQ